MNSPLRNPLVQDLAALVGLGLFSGGLSWAWYPLGPIALGLALMGGAYVAAVSTPPRR